MDLVSQTPRPRGRGRPLFAEHFNVFARCLVRVFRHVPRYRAADFPQTSISCKAGEAQWPPAVESSIAVEDAVENRGLYRVFVSSLF